MSKKNKKAAEESGFEAVEATLGRTERYIEDNQKSLTIIILAIVVIVGGYFGFKKFIVEPQQQEASEKMYIAEANFAIDSLNLALYGVPGDEFNMGFVDIADEYSLTKAGNLANYYAGISFLRLGQFEDALEYLGAFSSDDEVIMTMAVGAMGDAHMELGNNDDAISHYKKAAERKPNKFIAPLMMMKLGLAYEKLNELDKALVIYKDIQKTYPKSNEGRNIQKYIARVEFKTSK